MFPPYLIVDLASTAMLAGRELCVFLAAVWLYALAVHLRRRFF